MNIALGSGFHETNVMTCLFNRDAKMSMAWLPNIFIIITKKDWQCKAGRGRLTPFQSEDPNPSLSTYRGKEEKGKIVEDKKGKSN